MLSFSAILSVAVSLFITVNAGKTYSSQCPFGNPLIDSRTLSQWFCGRGPSSKPCPRNFVCNIDPADRFAVCCATQAPSVNPCSKGDPLVDAGTGEAWYCGLGPSSQPCPKTYSCKVDPADRFAVCCLI
ncbi:hypothetical protein BV898_09794 [Hypsibius exemplaris]|uniref:WAP domain-containing protein n=1 Tax=Hypsibius exemplaris TaxID=2072580 RepID=A0A1W0WLG3_HYPEX|nr:hypothetical protein BV898_09794 [Hypsibius exemplaris]